MISMFFSIMEHMLVPSTVALTYATAVPLSHRKRHAEFVRHDMWILMRYHGRWLLWQITTWLPKRRG